MNKIKLCLSLAPYLYVRFFLTFFRGRHGLVVSGLDCRMIGLRFESWCGTKYFSIFQIFSMKKMYGL